jgi:two-component system, OmpR family, heavy metal sensor histidine kinase CusS
MTHSLRFRLTAWYALILTAGFALFGGLIWWSLRHRLLEEVDQDLEGRISRFEKYFAAESAETSGNQLRDELDEFCQALPPQSYIDLRGASGFTFRYSSPIGDLRRIQRQFAIRGESFDLEVGTSISGVQHTLDLLRLLLLSLSPIVIAIACAGGVWLSGRALQPVRDITAAALHISIENLSERLPVPDTGDELAHLSAVLNMMLARLEGAVKTLSQFVADASHELRTPLAVIRTTAELSLRRARPAEAYRESLTEVMAEADRMTQLIEDLLTLARSDAQTAEMPLTPLDVCGVVRTVCQEMTKLASLRQVEIRTELDSAPQMTAANRTALHRLFLVLLDNAVKYSHPGGHVLVGSASTPEHTRISIRDSGAGIDQENLPHIFRRFYQADPSHTGTGHGLGLSLAESIARAHGATIEVLSTPGAGSQFDVVFPARGISHSTLSGNLQVAPVPLTFADSTERSNNPT